MCVIFPLLLCCLSCCRLRCNARTSTSTRHFFVTTFLSPSVSKTWSPDQTKAKRTRIRRPKCVVCAIFSYRRDVSFCVTQNLVQTVSTASASHTTCLHHLSPTLSLLNGWKGPRAEVQFCSHCVWVCHWVHPLLRTKANLAQGRIICSLLFTKISLTFACLSWVSKMLVAMSVTIVSK